MDWLETVNDPLIVVRAIHFTATAVTAGSMLFRVAVAEPALGSGAPATAARMQSLSVAWIGLAIAAVSGAIWVLLEAAAMSGLSLSEAMTADILSTVLNETQFGLVSEIRLALASTLAACLACSRMPWTRWPALTSAFGLIAALAWAGHAGSSVGLIGLLHLTADVLHLTAAAAWIGALVPLAMLLAVARRRQDFVWTSLARHATQRFSTLGLLSVGVLLITGVVNACILVGSFYALQATEYGRLVILKTALFAVMLLLAAANRFWLMPQLAPLSRTDMQIDALRRLTRNSVLEIILGVAVIAIVGALGILHPAIHIALA
ncbi:copper resistance D (plasmid) [Nitrobacter hamburgensis X14]|uniref:Copper resistance D n=1 Tax=Nitrobacter hamburgensis (strain DSM 10229 / NCIMB 13809 / X14) TaxID=323097 RepID=Q1QFL4_NITHX|nr:copper homeostasis membrane protein CopD [Nitrobacter hamburgensis]ABE64983.1 copper resistance D [Nitrobacter hamburgensis X14]